MENYEKISTIGEGTYGVVLKCKNRETGQIVAIKKFKESEEDVQIRKTALREIRMLKQLRNEHIVNLIDVFRRKGKLYLVFEHVDHTILDDLEKHPSGLSDHRETGIVHKLMWQVLKAVNYLHSHNCIHRDIKPENILVTAGGVIKLCDFGFARTLAGVGAKYTDYVATRWYRSPELLVGDTEYGKGVDIWAIGCIFAELLTGEPLFPGDSDIDQLYRIIQCLGPLTRRHMDVFHKNPLYTGNRLSDNGRNVSLETKLGKIGKLALTFLQQCLVYDTDKRADCQKLMSHSYFTENDWLDKYEVELKKTIDAEKEREQLERMRRRKSKKEDSGGRTLRQSLSKHSSQSLETPTIEKRKSNEEGDKRRIMPPIAMVNGAGLGLAQQKKKLTTVTFPKIGPMHNTQHSNTKQLLSPK